MEKFILSLLKNEAKCRAEEFHIYHNFLNNSLKRKRKYFTEVEEKVIYTPDEWNVDPKFIPFYVIKHRRQIAKSISRKILGGTYVPNSPIIREIVKNGKKRKVALYQLPDSAVSDKIYQDLIRKNKHRFSSFSYAYRNDRNVHYAIQDISNELKYTPRIFIAEFDFSDFFGSISHDFIYKQMERNCFQISRTEKKIIESFLRENNGKGIHLGTSISLFLANLACWELDRKLEDEGLRFARYADDTIIWARSYSKICKAFDIINDFSKESNIMVNYKKSDGISILQKQGMRAEFASIKLYAEFLGYKITVDSVGIKDRSVQNIKQQISYLLYNNLIQPLKQERIKKDNYPQESYDASFLTALMQIRRYLYGNLSENALMKYINGTYTKFSFKGIMSYYPLINDEVQIKCLDKWLVKCIQNALIKRKKLLEKQGCHVANIFPYTIKSESFINECKVTDFFGKKKGIFRIPSFMRIYLAIKLGIENEGIESVMNPKSLYYE